MVDRIRSRLLHDPFSAMSHARTSNSAHINDALRPKELFRRHFANAEQLTLDEAFEFAGTISNSYGNQMQVALSAIDFMVRVSNELYVADRFLEFDVANTDAAIKKALNGKKQKPVKMFERALSSMPPCGRPWTLAILETYVRRFSEKYRLVATYLSSSYTSVVVPKESPFKREKDVVAFLLRREGIDPRTPQANEWLCANGFRASEKKSVRTIVDPETTETESNPEPSVVHKRTRSSKEPQTRRSREPRHEARILPEERSNLLEAYDPEFQRLVEHVRTLLAEDFSNGLRLDSELDLERLRNKGARRNDAIVADADSAALDAALRRAGIVYQQKVYVLSHELDETLRDHVVDAVRNGVRTIYYSMLCRKLAGSIPLWVDEGFLRQRLVRVLPQTLGALAFRYSSDACLRVEPQLAPRAVADDEELAAAEIVRVWGDSKVATINELVQRLPYLPEDLVKKALKRDEFLPNGKDSYALFSLVEFDYDAIRNARQTVSNAMIYKKYFQLAKLPVGKMNVLNEELDTDTLQRAIFRQALADCFDLNGRLITNKGVKLHFTDIIIGFCKAHDKLNTSEILDFVNELMGSAKMQIAVHAAFESMVRVSENEFVSPQLLDFDVKKTDASLDKVFGKNDYLPIQGFTLLTFLPKCKFQWNLSLLEGYVCHFSERFELFVYNFNLMHLGAIVRTGSRFKNLDQVIDDAVAHSLCPLKPDSVIDWLKLNGYICSSRYNRINDVVSFAKQFRTRGL